MCERITFPVKVCESCVIHGELKLLERARRTASFSLGPRDKPKHLRRGEVCFLWETPLPPNCFCFSGSDVSCNHLGMRVCVTAVLLVPQQRRSFRLFARFFFVFFFFFFFWLPRRKKDKCYVSACEEQLLFHELGVTLRDLSCGSSVRRDSKCFLLLDSSTLGAMGAMKY